MSNEVFPLTRSLIESVLESLPWQRGGDMKLFLISGVAAPFLLVFTLWGDILNKGQPIELFKFHKK